MAKINAKYSDNYVPLRMDNVKVQWAHLIEPDTAYGNKWCVDIFLSDELSAEMEAEGFNLKASKDKDGKVIQKNIITAKREVVTKKGNNTAPKLYGPDGAAGFDKPIGNGSICNVKLTARKWDVCNTITCYIEELQVVKLVEFAAGSTGFADTTGGEDVPF